MHSGFLKFCASGNGENGQLEGHSTEQCISRDIQRCTNSRWLTDVSKHNRNNHLSIRPDVVLPALCYFLAAIPTLKVSLFFVQNKSRGIIVNTELTHNLKHGHCDVY